MKEVMFMKNIQELTYTVPELAKVLKIGMNAAYNLVHSKGSGHQHRRKS